MKTKLDKYLKVMGREAGKHGLDPLFSITHIRTYSDSDEVDIDYESKRIGKGGNSRKIKFGYWVNREKPKKASDAKVDEFLPLRVILDRASCNLVCGEHYEIELDSGRKYGYVSLNIDADKVDSFFTDIRDYKEAPSGSPESWLGALEENCESFSPQQLLSVIVGIYALGVEGFIVSEHNKIKDPSKPQKNLRRKNK